MFWHFSAIIFYNRFLPEREWVFIVDFYHLYLDETKIVDQTKGLFLYSLAGVAIKDSNLTSIRTDMARLKYLIWDKNDGVLIQPKDRIFHEAEIRSRNKSALIHYPYYSIFNIRKNVRNAIEGVGDIIERNDISVLGAVSDLGSIRENYFSSQNSYTGYYSCLKVIIENYVNFLFVNKAKGEIIFESRKDKDGDVLDSRTRKQVYKILSSGTMRYSATELQQHITGVKFKSKKANDVGLQIADFIPRPLILHHAGIKQSKPSIYQKIRSKRYGGVHSNQFDRFGVPFLD